jgi:RNase P/RNase MRP subunit p30
VAIDKISKMNQASVTVRGFANHQLPVGRVYRDRLKFLYSERVQKASRLKIKWRAIRKKNHFPNS